MKNMTIKWEQKAEEFTNSHAGKLGEIHLFLIVRPFAPSLDGDWKLWCHLPGIRDDLGRFKSVGAAQLKAAQALEYWFRKIGFIE